jgi:hypothetical protein
VIAMGSSGRGLIQAADGGNDDVRGAAVVHVDGMQEHEADVVVVAEGVQRLTSALQRARVATTGASPTTGRVGR